MEQCLSACLNNSSVALEVVQKTANAIGLSETTTTIVVASVAALASIVAVLLKYPRVQSLFGAVNTEKLRKLNNIEEQVAVVAIAAAASPKKPSSDEK